jgi:hypothetical protein
MKRIAIGLGVMCLALGMTPAMAGKKTTYVFVGLVRTVDEGSITVDVMRANNAGTRYADAHDWTVRASVDGSTVFNDDYAMVQDASDLRTGDGVRLKALKVSGQLRARSVDARYQQYTGTLDEFDDEVGTASITYDETDEFADMWLDAHDWPAYVDVDFDEDVYVVSDGDPDGGDGALIIARPNQDGDGLEAVYVETWRTDDGDPLGLPII